MAQQRSRRQKMMRRHQHGEQADQIDFRPVVKLFDLVGAATWLLTEIDPERPDVAFGLCDLGLCDLGLGSPEIGSVSLSELAAYRGPLGLGIDRDLLFAASKTLSEYATEADRLGRINA